MEIRFAEGKDVAGILELLRSILTTRSSDLLHSMYIGRI